MRGAFAMTWNAFEVTCGVFGMTSGAFGMTWCLFGTIWGTQGSPEGALAIYASRFPPRPLVAWRPRGWVGKRLRGIWWLFE